MYPLFLFFAFILAPRFTKYSLGASGAVFSICPHCPLNSFTIVVRYVLIANGNPIPSLKIHLSEKDYQLPAALYNTSPIYNPHMNIPATVTENGQYPNAHSMQSEKLNPLLTF